MYVNLVISNNKKLNYRRLHSDSARCGNGHPRSLKVIRCCANRCGIYDFLLALNSNLINLYLQPFLHIHTPPLFQMELEKDDWE